VSQAATAARRRAAALFALALFATPWTRASAQDPPRGDAAGAPASANGSPAGETTAAASEESERLRRVRAEIEDLRARLLRGESETGSLLDALDEIDLKMAVFAREAILLRGEIAATRRARERALSEAQAARRRVAKAEGELRGWLAELYKAGPTSSLRMALAASSPAQILTAERVAESLAREQGRRVGTLRSERGRMETSVRTLEETEARLERLASDLEERQKQSRAARQDKSALLDGIRERQEKGEEALQALVQSERDLQAFLTTLPGGPGGPTPSYGLSRFQGLLDWPAKGKVAIPFGNVKHPKFNTQVPHPGVEVACPPGQTVQAVFDGRVVFSSWFKGYGQMIVIDHGDEYLSIYGQLGERLVEAGQEVRRDQPIARSGDEGTFGVTGLYFEIRHHGRAEDPVPWMRRTPGRASSR
jgi:septal ring factor EnvC (AmiA/AmiB activator)